MLPASIRVRAVVGYIFLVLYTSLIPFDFSPVPLAQAWGRFAEIPFLSLGVGDRVDWVANLLLYAPLAFLLAETTTVFHWYYRSRFVLLSWAFVVSSVIAVSVEFVQIYFPPRTVSLNDIYAEVLGAALGVIAHAFFRDGLLGGWRRMLAGGVEGLRAGLGLYSVAYLALSLFPYDFLLTAGELQAKLSRDTYGLLFVSGACSEANVCAGKLAIEAAAIVPIGIYMGLRKGGGVIRGFLVGAVLGLGIEAAQMIIASGRTQGMSVVMRAVGVAGGVWLSGIRVDRALSYLERYFRGVVLIGSLPYLVVLLWAAGAIDAKWLPIGEVVNRISDISLIPFYHYYYTPETVAARNFIANLALYMPAGIGYGFWFGRRLSGRRLVLRAGASGAVLALSIECLKIFNATKISDVTDVLIGAGAGALGCAIVLWLYRSVYADSRNVPGDIEYREPETKQAEIRSGFALMPSVAAVAILLVVGWIVIHYPLNSYVLAGGLMVYFTILQRWPQSWLFLIPAILPVFDFGLWSGWLFLSELAVFAMVTIAAALWRGTHAVSMAGLSGIFKATLLLVALSYMISVGIGVALLEPFAEGGLADYMSAYNAVRVGTGVLLALLLAPLLISGGDLKGHINLFTNGMVVGLALASTSVIIERYLFPGLFNFDNPYRVTGMFSEMHTGGPFIEGYLALAIPFLAFWYTLNPSRKRFVFALVLLVAGLYSVFVTFSRGGYVALAVVATVLAIGLIYARRDPGARMSISPWAVVSGLVVAVGVVMAISNSLYVQSRFEKTESDIERRIQHWKMSVDLMDRDWFHQLFGMGMGTYPLTYYFRNPDGYRPGNYSVEREEENAYLRIGSGDSLFIAQRIQVGAHSPYTLSLDFRSTIEDDARLVIYLCEQSLLSSYQCKTVTLRDAGTGSWRRVNVPLDSGQVGEGKWYTGRPVALTFRNAREGTTVDIDNVALLGPGGKNLVSNGDFSRSTVYWYFTTDHFWPWRVENILLQTYFEQGWLGLVALCLLIGYLLVRLARLVHLGDFRAACFLAALSGLLVVGMVGSVLDSARISMLFFLIAVLVAGYPGYRAQAIRSETM